MTPQEFEQQVSRIVHTLSGTEAQTTVTWDARIPDPDNPTQLRQIDIAIRRGGELALVECRHRNCREDVQWIEELYGRKESLRAVSVIAVSSQGFTRGAVAKAARLGVFLRILSEVTSEDVLSWGTKTKVHVTFVQMTSIHFAIVVSDRINVPTPPAALRTDKGDSFPFSEMISGVARQLDATKGPEGLATVQINLNRIYLGMTPVNEALLSFKWRRLKREVALPVLLAYERIDSGGRTLDALVEKNYHSDTEVHQAPSGGFAVIDLGALPFEECCTVTGAEVVFAAPVSLKGVGVIGPTERAELIRYQMSTITRNDPQYHRIVSSSSFVELGKEAVPVSGISGT